MTLLARTIMTGLTDNVEDLLTRLADHSRTELTLIRSLADSIRRVDEQMLRELRGVTLQHEIRRETILGELQKLAGRLCSLPVKPLSPVRQTIEQQPYVEEHVFNEPAQTNGVGADWRQAAQNIQDELEFVLNPLSAKH
jgi:hypothetical protein